MSDLTASHCGCNKPEPAQCGGGCGGILWIIILMCLCGNKGESNGCGSSCGGGMDICGSGEGGCGMIFLILILCGCCGGGSGGFF